MQQEYTIGQEPVDMDRTILVVEDDESIGLLLVEVLSQETEYKAVLVSDGIEALHIAGSIQPCLLITDYRLPKMNGIELYDQLQSEHILENVPTIMLSAYPPKDEVRKRKLISMEKPFELDDLLDMVINMLDCDYQEGE